MNIHYTTVINRMNENQSADGELRELFKEKKRQKIKERKHTQPHRTLFK